MRRNAKHLFKLYSVDQTKNIERKGENQELATIGSMLLGLSCSECSSRLISKACN